MFFSFDWIVLVSDTFLVLIFFITDECIVITKRLLKNPTKNVLNIMYHNIFLLKD
jgi:hypothetical protein